MRVVSLFSGIGGFELGMKPEDEIVGFSEVDKHSVGVYTHHFPDTPALGDVRSIDWSALDYDMIVGGSPCTDVSSAATLRGNSKKRGLDGEQSSLFYDFVKGIRHKPSCHIILENVASMSKKTKAQFTDILRKASSRRIHVVTLSGARWTGQARRRHIWTTFPVPELPEPGPRTPRVDWLSHLLPVSDVAGLAHSEKAIALMDADVGGQTRWAYLNGHQDTDFAEARIIRANFHKGVPANVLIDRRGGENNTPFIRKMAPIEVERLMGFPDNWTRGPETKRTATTNRLKMLGNAVIPQMVQWARNSLED